MRYPSKRSRRTIEEGRKSLLPFFMTYTWLNPPAGEYTIEEYLKMHAYWRDSLSLSRNKLASPTNPLNAKYFGNKKVTFRGDLVILEALHE
jgi:hypothetical protein